MKRILTNHLFLIVAILLGLCLGCQPSQETTTAKDPSPWIDLLHDDSGQLTREMWETHFVRNAKVGHRRTRDYSCEHDGQPYLRTETVDVLETKRFGDIAEQQLRTVSLELPDGQIQQIAYDVKNAQTSISADGIVQGDQLHLTKKRGGETEGKRTFHWTRLNGGPFAIERSLRKAPMKSGESRDISAFVPVLDRVVEFRLEAKGIDSIEINGEPVDCLRVVAFDKNSDGWTLPTFYWIDEDGDVLKMHEGLLDRITVKSSEEAAKRPNDLVQLDLGLDAGVPLADDFPQPHQTRRAIYRVTVDGIAPKSVFAEGLSQQLIAPQGDPETVLLTVERISPDHPVSW